MTLSAMASLLFILLLFAKITGLATLSWLMVFSPFLALAGVIVLLCIVTFVALMFSEGAKRPKK